MKVSKSNIALSYHGKFYTRSGSTTQELKGGALQRLLLKTNNLSWDEVPVSDANFDDIDTEVVRRFIKQATGYNRLPSGIDSDNIKQLFYNLKLTNKNDELTRAAVLLFGKNPTRFFSSAIFKIGRFRGEDPTDLLVSDFVEGNLFQMPDKVVDLLKSKYLLSPISYSGLQRIETLEIPEKSMREAVLNAIIHRDYTSTSSIELRVFDHSITLWNYGKLEDLSIADLRITHNSNPRNSLMAQIFYRAGYIESWGRGTLTIINETEISLTERQTRAIDYVRENGSITNKIYQELNTISKPTATRDLAELVSLGIFEIDGKGRTLRYLKSAHNRLIIGS